MQAGVVGGSGSGSPAPLPPLPRLSRSRTSMMRRSEGGELPSMESGGPAPCRISRRLFSQASIAAPTALLADSSRTARFAGFSPTALCRWRGVGRYIQLRETQNTEKQKRAFDAVKTTDPRLH